MGIENSFRIEYFDDAEVHNVTDFLSIEEDIRKDPISFQSRIIRSNTFVVQRTNKKIHSNTWWPFISCNILIRFCISLYIQSNPKNDTLIYHKTLQAMLNIFSKTYQNLLKKYKKEITYDGSVSGNKTTFNICSYLFIFFKIPIRQMISMSINIIFSSPSNRNILRCFRRFIVFYCAPPRLPKSSYIYYCAS